MADRLTFIWTVLAATITTVIGLMANYTVNAKWIAPMVMFAAMITLASYGRIRRRKRD